MIKTIIVAILAIILIFLLIKFIKSKNYKVLIFLVIIILFFLFCFLYVTNKEYEYEDKDEYEYEYEIIYDEELSKPDRMIISDINEYNEFMSDSDEWKEEYLSSDKYNKKYFKNKSIALVTISTGGFVKGADLSYDNDVLIVKPNIVYADGDIADIVSYVILLVEVNKNITSIEIQWGD